MLRLARRLGHVVAPALVMLMTHTALAEPPPETSDPAADLGDFDESMLLGAVPSVSGVSKYEQRASNAPATVTVVTSEEIARHGWRTLDEILASVRSFYRSDDRAYAALGVRGFSIPGDYGSRILLLLDGARLNDAMYDGLPLGRMFPIPVELIDRIEVIRGPTSALYGSNALLAVVNVISKRGRDLEGAAASLEVGDTGSYDLHAHVGHRMASGAELRLGATALLDHGYDYDFSSIALPSDLSGLAHDADGERALSVSARAAYRQWTLSASFSQRKKFLPTGAWSSVLGSDGTFETDRFLVVTGEFADHLASGIDVAARVALHHYHYQSQFYYREEAGAAFEDLYQRDHAEADVLRTEVSANLFILPELRLALGTELELHLLRQQDSTEQIGDQPAERLLHIEDSIGTAAASAHLEWTPQRSIAVDLSMRLDYRQALGVTLSPRVALIMSPSIETVFKAIAGRAFRAPNAFETSYTDNISIKAPASLGPETVQSFELAWEQLFGPSVRTVVDTFFYELDDLVVLTADPADDLLVYANRGSMSAVGVEAEVGLALDPLDLTASVSFQRASEGVLRLASSPLLLAKLQASMPIIDERLGVGLDIQYMSSRRTLAGADTDPVVLVNLALTSENLLPGLSLRATFDNVLDYRYADPGSSEQRLDAIPQPGFGFHFRLGYRF